MGRKRKIPAGYMPRWHSDTDSSGNEQGQYSSVVQSGRPLSDLQSSSKRGKTSEEEEPKLQVAPESLVEEGAESDDAPAASPLNSEEGFVVHETDDAASQLNSDASENNHGIITNASQDSPGVFQEEDMDNSAYQEPWYADDYLDEEEDNADEDEEDDDNEVDEENKESFTYLFRKFAEDWTTAEVNHRVSKRASAGFWNVARKWMGSLTSAFNKDGKKKFPKYEHTRKKITKENVPPISMDIGYLHKESGELTIVEDSDKNPILKFPSDVYEKVYEIASIKVKKTFLPNLSFFSPPFFTPDQKFIINFLFLYPTPSGCLSPILP